MYHLDELSERVEIRRYSVAPANEYGTLPRTASTVATVWALVRPMSGRERDRAQQTEARANYLVVIRNNPGLSVAESDRIIWRNQEMNIRFIKQQGPRPLFLEIEAELNAP